MDICLESGHVNCDNSGAHGISMSRAMMRGAMRHIPDFVYELLPYVYILVGILAMVKIPGQLGTFSGLVLLAAGLLVFKWRLEHRSTVRVEVRQR
jgi:hypothetical protein